MTNISAIVSYAFATIAGMCFVGGIAVLTGGKKYGNA